MTGDGLEEWIDEVLKLIEQLTEVVAQARLLASAVPLKTPATVLPFVRPIKPPTDGGDAA